MKRIVILISGRGSNMEAIVQRCAAEGWPARVAAVIFLGWMWYSIVVTANHYFLDMVLGGAIVTACLAIAYQWELWTERHPAGVRRWFPHIREMRLPF